MKPYWLVLMLVPIADAQTSNKCADLTGFKISGFAMVITKSRNDSRIFCPRNVHR